MKTDRSAKCSSIWTLWSRLRSLPKLPKQAWKERNRKSPLKYKTHGSTKASSSKRSNREFQKSLSTDSASSNKSEKRSS